MSSTSELEAKSIDSIIFGILNPTFIRRYSAAEIFTDEVYDEDGTPITGGVMDLRLGTIEPNQRCQTCGNPPSRCPGHFGHIELPMPMVNYLFTKQIYTLLQITCRSCGRLLLPQDRIEEYKKQIEEYKEKFGFVPERLYSQIIREAKRMSNCPHCGASQYVIKWSKPTEFYEITPEKTTSRINPSAIRERFERIPDEDLKLLGINPETSRPEWMILEVLPVPPVQVRPSIVLESGERSEDDLTHKLVDIIRAAKKLKEGKENGANPVILGEFENLLQYHITTYLDNEASGIPPSRHRTGKVLKTLTQRLKGKEGRFRKNLSGKRVDFSARTVISPDPFLDIDEVGVPEAIAKALSVPERVNSFNRDRLVNLVRNGPNKYPGALYVIRPDGARIKLDFVKDLNAFANSISEGYIVERHLMDGDYVIFNRQPSLHRISMMGHRVKVLPGRTMRLHPSVCPPYNADFDGDEMNLHVPQNTEAVAETKELLEVNKNFITPRYGAPIIGALRDLITGAYLLTRKDTYLTKKDFLLLMAAAGIYEELPEPVIKEPEPLWSGKQAFSLLLPKDFEYKGKAKVCANCKECDENNCPNEGFVIIRGGILEKGVIDQAAIGSEKAGTILHELILRYGNGVAHNFLRSLSRMVIKFLQLRGFTMLYSELFLPEESRKEIDELLNTAEPEVNKIIEDFRSGKLERIPGKSEEDSLEAYIMDKLSEIRTKTGEIASNSLGMNNNAVIMTRTGARGSDLNLGHICASLGPQSLHGKRISRGYIGRPLPHFRRGDLGATARGFIRSSYLTGLTPTEFFYHAMGGRESLVDTAVRTQQSGYLQRRLIHALETLKVEYDGTVRDPYGNIVEFKYGDDGIDPSKTFHGIFPLEVYFNIIVKSLNLKTKAEVSDQKIDSILNAYSKLLPKILIDKLKREIKKYGIAEEHIEKVVREVVKKYEETIADPGESVGIVAAQSIGEPGTQMTLRTFHYAGVREANVTLGLPRLIELLDVHRTPKTPIMKIYLKPEYSKSREEALKVARKLVYKTLEFVSTEIRVLHLRNLALIVLSDEALQEAGLKKSDIVKALNLAGFKNPKFSKKRSNVILVKLKEEKEASTLDFSASVEKLKLIPISGVPSITRASVEKEGDEWIIKTEGSNLMEVIKLPEVDPTRVYTNNIVEIQEVLGIEAARTALIREIKSTLEEQGLDVDIRHISLVASAMTASGKLKQIGRHGLSGEKVSILAKAAFERTVPTLVDGAIMGETDYMRGMTERVLAGEEIKAGTGIIDIFVNLPSS